MNKVPLFDPARGDRSTSAIIRIVNKSKHPLPSYATEHVAGMDLRGVRYF